MFEEATKHIENREVHTVRTFCTRTQREQREKNVGGAWTVSGGQRREMTQVDTISIICCEKLPLVLLLCKTLVWGQPQRAVLINKFQHFDIWSLPSIFDHAGRFEVQQKKSYIIILLFLSHQKVTFIYCNIIKYRPISGHRYTKMLLGSSRG